MSQLAEPLNVLLVAEESAGLQTLRLLANSGYHVVAVMSQPTDDPKSGALWNHARRMGFPTWPAKWVKQATFAEQVRQHKVDLLLNVHSLFVIHPDVLRACRISAYNLHPGPLPERAGINVPSWSIYEGETEHGVTLHEMLAEIDAGTIAYQARFPISETDTGVTLMSQCVRQGIPLIKRLLDDIAGGPNQIPKLRQDFSRRRYFDRSIPNHGWIDWQSSASEVFNHIRAADYSPFPSPWGAPRTQCGDQQFGLVKAKLTGKTCDVEPGTVGPANLVATDDEWLEIKTVEIDGRFVAADQVLASGQRLIGLTMPNVTVVSV